MMADNESIFISEVKETNSKNASWLRMRCIVDWEFIFYAGKFTYIYSWPVNGFF